MSDDAKGKLSPWVKAEQIAEEFDISVRTANDWMLKMRHFREGRVIRVARATYEAWKRDQMQGPTDCTRSVGARRESKASKLPPRGGRNEAVEKEPTHVVRPRWPVTPKGEGSSRGARNGVDKERIHVARAPRKLPSPTQ